MKRIFILLIIALPAFAYSQQQDIITIGKRYSIYSKILKEDRPYLVHLPSGYNNSQYGKNSYPVLYLLDGDAHFNSVSSLIEILGSGINGTYVIPDMIVVAIPNTDRTRDLTPTHNDTDNDGHFQPGQKNSGGNNNFLHFIRDELIQHIDSAYRTMPYRVFVGHSYGGIAVINALYTMPETFNAYIAIDPSLWWDHQVLLEKAKNYFQHANLKGKSLYVAQANTMVLGDTSVNMHFESIKLFETYLETRNRSGLAWKYNYYDDDEHGSVPLIAEYDGLRFIFNDYHMRWTKILFHPELLREQLNRFSKQTMVKFAPPEDVLNSWGYNMMNSKMYEQAEKYFQMAIDYYPNSANAYDSMGEFMMNKGDNLKAIENYKKSLMLNPNNDNAKKMVEKMQSK